MKPAPFSYVAPDSLEAALDALQEHGDEAKVLAGGQSLIPAMNFRLMAPAVLIDINRIDSLSYIEPDPSGGLRIGGLTRQRRVERSTLVAERAPLLHETMPEIAHPQIRNRGTIGGSLAHADPAAELPVIALALDADIRVQSARGERTLPANEFFQFMFTTDLAPDEILIEVILPPMAQGAGWAFLEFARRRGDYAQAGVAAVLGLDEDGNCSLARLVYLNLGDGPVEGANAQKILLGQPPGPDLFRAAAEEAAKEVDPAGSVHATPEYQRHLARVLTERALATAHSRSNRRPADD